MAIQDPIPRDVLRTFLPDRRTVIAFEAMQTGAAVSTDALSSAELLIYTPNPNIPQAKLLVANSQISFDTSAPNQIKFNVLGATKLSTARDIAITGDLAWSVNFDGSANVTAAGTLATVNANVGAFGSATSVPTVTVNAKGLVTAASASRVVVPGFLYGMQATAAGATATMAITAGAAADQTNAALIFVASAYTKTGGAWSVGSGNGGLDTGTIAANTTYHFHAIRRPDTGVTDYAFSLNPAGPTTGGAIPAAYTQSRRIFSWCSDGSAQWRKGFQYGDNFTYDPPIQDGSGIATVTTAALRTMTVPAGLNIPWVGTISFDNNSLGPSSLLVTSPLEADRVPNAILGDITLYAVNTTNLLQVVMMEVIVDTASRIRHRSNVATGTLYFVTRGWIDTRGREG